MGRRSHLDARSVVSMVHGRQLCPVAWHVILHPVDSATDETVSLDVLCERGFGDGRLCRAGRSRRPGRHGTPR